MNSQANCQQHNEKIKLAEAATAGHTSETLSGKERLANDCDKPRLVNILTFAGLIERTIAFVAVKHGDLIFEDRDLRKHLRWLFANAGAKLRTISVTAKFHLTYFQPVRLKLT